MNISPKDLINLWEEIAAKADSKIDGPYLFKQLKGGNLPIGAILRSIDRKPGLLVRFPASSLDELPKPDAGRGFTFERPVAAGNSTLGLPILLSDPSVKDLFAAMGADLVSEVEKSQDESTAAQKVLRRIALWRRFLQRRDGLLSNEEVRGLFGELHVLSIAITKRGVDEALESWHGPERDLHDFRFDEGAVEVKTWRAESGAKIYISNADQITIDSVKPMQIAAVQISAGATKGMTLAETVNNLKSQMSGMQVQRFEELLAAYGYLELHANDYNDRMQVLEFSLFSVREGFPHIETRNIPGGIGNLKYSIELGAVESFKINNSHILCK
jgi:hypothetical protein